VAGLACGRGRRGETRCKRCGQEQASDHAAGEPVAC